MTPIHNAFNPEIKTLAPRDDFKRTHTRIGTRLIAGE